MIPEAAVTAAAKALFADNMSNHSGDNAPQIIGACEKVARKILEAAAPHMAPGMEWAVFRAQGGPNESPAENLRYKTRESAQAAIDSGYSQPQYWEPRGRAVGAWA